MVQVVHLLRGSTSRNARRLSQKPLAGPHSSSRCSIRLPGGARQDHEVEQVYVAIDDREGIGIVRRAGHPAVLAGGARDPDTMPTPVVPRL